MHLIKPSAIGHLDERGKRHAIYSLDFQPGGPRLATGASDSAVKIWNMETFLSAASNAASTMNVSSSDNSEHYAADANFSGSPMAADEVAGLALLATLRNHTKSVNIVRWNNDGSFLASGSDDCYVLIYKLLSGPAPAAKFGSSEASSVEHWSRCAILHGHSMDVLDIDWSPHGLLVSGSIDNTICVWDMRAVGTPGASVMHNPIQVLRGHESYVKGVAFDPMGKYMVSCGSDNLLCVWDADSWELVVRLDGPMKGSTERACSLFRRISWSPDGQSFSASACTKSGRPVGMIIKRGSWEAGIDLVGHQQPSLSTRFAPYLVAPVSTMSSEESNGSPTSAVPLCMVAMGDALGVVSLWTSSSNKAVLVLKDAFEGKNKAATDIAWARWGGRDAFAVSSMDGTVVVVDVRGQFGAPLSPAALDRHFKKYYGRSFQQTLHYHTDAQLLADAAPLQFMTAQGRRGSALPGLADTSPGPLQAYPVHSARPPTSPQRTQPIDNPLPQSSNVPINAADVLRAQTTTTGKDGKKRIAPVLLQSSDASIGSSASQGNASEPVAPASSAAKRPRTAGAFGGGAPTTSRMQERTVVTHSVHYKTHEEIALAPLAPDASREALCVHVKPGSSDPTANTTSFMVGLQRLARPATLSSALKTSGIVGPSNLSGLFLRTAVDDRAIWMSAVAGDATCVAGCVYSGIATVAKDTKGSQVPDGIVAVGE